MLLLRECPANLLLPKWSSADIRWTAAAHVGSVGKGAASITTALRESKGTCRCWRAHSRGGGLRLLRKCAEARRRSAARRPAARSTKGSAESGGGAPTNCCLRRLLQSLGRSSASKWRCHSRGGTEGPAAANGGGEWSGAHRRASRGHE